MIQEINGFIRKIVFFPAFDKTDKDPKKDYGISDVEIRFVLLRAGKGVEFSLSSNWHLPHIFDRRMDAIREDILVGKERFLWERFAKEFLQEVCLWDAFHVREDGDDWIEFDTFNRLSYLDSLHPNKKVWYYWLPDREKVIWTSFLTDGEDAIWNGLESIYNENFSTK